MILFEKNCFDKRIFKYIVHRKYKLIVGSRIIFYIYQMTNINMWMIGKFQTQEEIKILQKHIKFYNKDIISISSLCIDVYRYDNLYASYRIVNSFLYLIVVILLDE